MQAFNMVYQKYHAYLYMLALKYLKDKCSAEDAVQQTFVKLWETAKNIEIEVNLRNYLYTMTKNYVINQIRNHKETVSIHYANAQKEIIDSHDFVNTIDEIQISESLRDGIDNLPPQKREICMLKMEGNTTNQDIADRMGISVNTVKSHYQEAIKMLRKHFKRTKTMLL